MKTILVWNRNKRRLLFDERGKLERKLGAFFRGGWKPQVSVRGLSSDLSPRFPEISNAGQRGTTLERRSLRQKTRIGRCLVFVAPKRRPKSRREYRKAADCNIKHYLQYVPPRCYRGPHEVDITL